MNETKENKFTIVIDYREHHLIKLLEINYPKFAFIKKNLDIGDICIYQEDVLLLVIERKTILDLAASIKDGRYREQKIRLKSVNVRIIYLIEGHMNENANSGISDTILWSVFTKVMLRDNFFVFRTMNLEETCKLLVKISDKWTECCDYKDNVPQYIDCIKIKKKDNIDPTICFIKQLSQINGISVTISKAIVIKYKTMANLIIEYLKIDNLEKINDATRLKLKKLMLKNIIVNEKRKVGKITSERIYNYLFGL